VRPGVLDGKHQPEKYAVIGHGVQRVRGAKGADAGNVGVLLHREVGPAAEGVRRRKSDVGDGGRVEADVEAVGDHVPDLVQVVDADRYGDGIARIDRPIRNVDGEAVLSVGRAT
jgi:hypothetical protein